jgi:hypothetical protein
MGGDPHRVEYANLHRMDPATIHIEQFHIAKVHTIQSLTDVNRQIAVPLPAPSQASIDFFIKPDVAIHNLHNGLLLTSFCIRIRFRERDVTIHSHIEPIARTNLHRWLDIQILPRNLHAQLAELLAKRLSCFRTRRQDSRGRRRLRLGHFNSGRERTQH